MSTTTNTFGSIQEELAYYKAQYAHLEAELQDFQQSSRELETELEKDVEASEKRERELRDKVEALSHQTEEWKNKYKQSRTEANTAQNTLQKEITSLRETNRTLQMRLRDMEVANDEIEAQARNTTSSLDDLESKYNHAIERNVLLEEEMKDSEQEREALKIETQRLRDELSDLTVENEITLNKMRVLTTTMERPARQIAQLKDDHKRLSSTASERSAATTSTAATSEQYHQISEKTTSEPQTPPSPPLSHVSGRRKVAQSTSTPSRLSPMHRDDTPRPAHVMQQKLKARPSYGARRMRSSIASTDKSTVHVDDMPQTNDSLMRSNSLYQIRGLMGKMQKLEERLQTAKARLPAPPRTPPEARSPKGGPAQSQLLPQSVTTRSTSKRRSMLPPPIVSASQVFDPRSSILSSKSHRPPVPPKDPPRSQSSLSHRNDASQAQHDHEITLGQAELSTRSRSRMSLSASRGSPLVMGHSNEGTTSRSAHTTFTDRRTTNIETSSLALSESSSRPRISGRSSLATGSLRVANSPPAATDARRRSNIVRPGIGSMLPPERRRPVEVER